MDFELEDDRAERRGRGGTGRSVRAFSRDGYYRCDREDQAGQCFCRQCHNLPLVAASLHRNAQL